MNINWRYFKTRDTSVDMIFIAIRGGTPLETRHDSTRPHTRLFPMNTIHYTICVLYIYIIYMLYTSIYNLDVIISYMNIWIKSVQFTIYIYIVYVYNIYIYTYFSALLNPTAACCSNTSQYQETPPAESIFFWQTAASRLLGFWTFRYRNGYGSTFNSTERTMCLITHLSVWFILASYSFFRQVPKFKLYI